MLPTTLNWMSFRSLFQAKQTKTASDMHVFEHYCSSIMGNKERCPVAELDLLLGHFFKDITKSNGEDYEPDSPTAFTNQHLKQKGYSLDIITAKEFETSRQALHWQLEESNFAARGNVKSQMPLIQYHLRRKKSFSEVLN